ncbi:MAG: hypothetical protein E4G99_13560, partial [Anaerolineales bacterium]
MTSRFQTPPWADPAWLEEVRDWIGVELARSGHEIIGSLERLHERPWSTVYQVPTSAGKLIFKA